MKGTILDFSIQTNSGIILGDDENRYPFISAEWKENRPPQRGDKVDFVVDINQDAISIYLTNQIIKATNHHLIAEKDYNLFDWFLKCMRNYINFKGRARRKEFWYFQLVVFISILCIAFFLGIMGGNDSVIDLVLTLYILGIVLPQYAVTARRLHDIGKSGWWQLISIIPIVGLILIYWCAQEGDKNENKYGLPSK